MSEVPLHPEPHILPPQGLRFLHTDMLLAHGNIRPANILLTRLAPGSPLQVYLRSPI
jgi:hypothetical protein